MLAEIEQAVLDALAGAGLNIREIDVQKDKPASRILSTPAAHTAIETGKMERLTSTTTKITPTLLVMIIFKDLKSERVRRAGMFPILEGVLQLLAGNKLGLAISGLTPRRFDNITDDDLVANGMVAFLMEFETSYTITATDPDEAESAPDLLRIGLDYYLQEPADDTVDASDLVELTEGD